MDGEVEDLILEFLVLNGEVVDLLGGFLGLDLELGELVLVGLGLLFGLEAEGVELLLDLLVLVIELGIVAGEVGEFGLEEVDLLELLGGGVLEVVEGVVEGLLLEDELLLELVELVEESALVLGALGVVLLEGELEAAVPVVLELEQLVLARLREFLLVHLELVVLVGERLDLQVQAADHVLRVRAQLGLQTRHLGLQQPDLLLLLHDHLDRAFFRLLELLQQEVLLKLLVLDREPAPLLQLLLPDEVEVVVLARAQLRFQLHDHFLIVAALIF